jgi:uncharacterized protein (DUF3084 family)
MRVLKILRRSLLVIFLVISLAWNVATTAFEWAYNATFSLVSSAVSLVLDGNELKSSVKHQLDSKTKDLDRLAKRISAADADIIAKERKIANMSSNVLKLEQEIKSVSDEVLDLGTQNQSLKRVITVKDVELKNKTSQLKTTEAKVVKVQNRLMSLQETLRKSQNDILKINNEKNMVIAERNALKGEVQKKQALINRADQTIRRQNNEVVANANKLERLEGSNINLQDKLSKSEFKVSDLDAQNKSLAADSKKLQDTVKSQTQALNEFDTRVTLQRTKLLELENLNGSLGNKLDFYKRANRDVSTKITQLSDNINKRIITRIGRNLGAMPAESIPVAGIGVTLTMMYLEIQDACSTLSDISDFTEEMGYEKDGGGAEFCSLKQSDLKRLINKNKYNLEDCLSRVSEDDYEGIQTCINDN